MHKLLTCQVSFHLHRQHRPTLGGSECQTSSPPMQAAAHFAGPTPRTSQASEMLRLWQSSKRQLLVSRDLNFKIDKNASQGHPDQQATVT